MTRPKPKPNEIDAFVDSLSESGQTVELDVSFLFGAEEGTHFWYYEDLAIEDFYKIPEESAKYQQSLNVPWDMQLLGYMLTMARAHKSPMPQTVGRIEIYAQLAKKRPMDYLKLSNRFFEKFPHLLSINWAGTEKKSGDG